MLDTSSALRAPSLDALFAQICRAKPQEARDLSMLLTPAERAEMALFCYARVHTREQGRSIAGACTRDEMVRAGGYAGAALYDRAEGRADTWGDVAVFGEKGVSTVK